jgi:hypothetical protein
MFLMSSARGKNEFCQAVFRVGGSIPPPAMPLKTRRVQQNLGPDEFISCVGTVLKLSDWLSDRLPAR